MSLGHNLYHTDEHVETLKVKTFLVFLALMIKSVCVPESSLFKNINEIDMPII